MRFIVDANQVLEIQRERELTAAQKKQTIIVLSALPEHGDKGAGNGNSKVDFAFVRNLVLAKNKKRGLVTTRWTI